METIFDKPLDKQVAENTQAIANKIVYEDYEYTTVSNQYVSPFSAYIDVTVAKAGYMAIAAQIMSTKNTYIGCTSLRSGATTCDVWTNSPSSGFIRVTYIKI